MDWTKKEKKIKGEHCCPCGQIHCACHALLSPCRVHVGRAAEKQQLNRAKPAERGTGCDLWTLGLIHRIYPWSHPPAPAQAVSLSLSLHLFTDAFSYCFSVRGCGSGEGISVMYRQYQRADESCHHLFTPSGSAPKSHLLLLYSAN